jgi:hypothetical protein
MASSINGCGTKYHGKAEPKQDGSYIATLWIVFIFIPLIPLGSQRLWPVAQTERGFFSRGGMSFKAQKVSLHLPHVLMGYAITLAIAILLKVH